jgi:hypothetical protein
MPFRLPTCKLLHLRTSGVVLDGQVTYEQPTSNDPVFGTPVLGSRCGLSYSGNSYLLAI